MTDYWRAWADSVSVSVKVQPKSRRPGGQGRSVSATGARLRISVNEAPEDGRANSAACAVLAKALHVPIPVVPIPVVALTLGQTGCDKTSRDKTLHVTGDAPRLTAILETP